MDKKLAKNIFFSVICSLLLLGGVLTAVLTISPNNDTNAFNSTFSESANAVVVSEIWNGSTFDPDNTQTLLNMLCNSSSGSISTLSSKIGSGTINATTLRGYSSGGNTAGKSIVVTLGGFKWIVTYLFKDSDGNTCATLWMADANGEGSYGSNSSYYGSSNWTSGYPGSMYGTSYMSVYILNNGGDYANIRSNSNATSLTSHSSSSTHQYAAFTHSSGGIRPYIVQPNNVPYQTKSQGSSYSGEGYVLMNESLATNLTGYYSTCSYQGLTGYTNWGDDYLWIPSLSETGYNSSYPGMWQTSQAERASAAGYCWSRTCHFEAVRGVYNFASYTSGDVLRSDIVYYKKGIRPALHLNLSKVLSSISVTLSFDKQGGTGGTNSISYILDSGSPSAITPPTRVGYTFGGYYSGTGGSGIRWFSNTGSVATVEPVAAGDAITLYAKWTINTYTVAYNNNGGSGTMSNSSHTYGTAKKLTANTFTRTGYTFLGWSTSSTATTVVYTDGQSVSNLTTTNGATVTLYAVWQANTYYVKYNGNGGSGNMSNSTHTYGTASSLTVNAFSKTGYTFAGWATSSAGTVAYNNGASVSTLTATNGATVELFAKWTANTYTVAYNNNGGSGTMTSTSHTYDIAKNLSKNTFTREGYRFLGWSTSNTATTPTYIDEESVVNLATSGTVTLYAVWKLNILIEVLSNNTDAGTVTGGGYFEVGEQVTLGAMGKVGYGLLYWVEYDANGDEIAKHTENPLTITVSANKTYKAFFGKCIEGIGVSSTIGGVAYIVGDDFSSLGQDDYITFSAKLVLAGYVFSHWQDLNGNNLGTEMSVKLKKSVVMDNLITAVFVSATNNNVNNNTSN